MLAYAALSLLWSNADPLYSGLYLASLALAAIVGYKLESIRLLWLGAIVAVSLNLLSIPWLIYGLYGNPNAFGGAIALCLAAALAYRFYWFIPLAIAGLVYNQSRGAILAAGVTVFYTLWRYSRFFALASLGLLPFVLLTIKVDGGVSTFARLGIWQDTLNHLEPFGRGWGSFFNNYIAFYIHTNATLMSASHAYNDLLELVFELGIGAIPAIWLLLLSFESSFSHRVILATFVVLSLTFFPLHIPFVGHMFILTTAHALREREPRRLNYGTLAPHGSPLFAGSRHAMGIQRGRSHDR